MPYNDTTRPYADLDDIDRLNAIFTFKPIASVKHEGLRHEVPEGAAYVYPPLMQFLVLMASRIFGSQNEAMHALNHRGVWDRCCDQYRALVGKAVNLPSKPPTAAMQNRYLHRLCTFDGLPTAAEDGQQPSEVIIDWDSKVDPLALLSVQFTRVAIGQAMQQGQFPKNGGLPDFANPDMRFCIFGDGTWLPPYSNVTPTWDKDNQAWKPSGSRATRGKPRIQDVCKRYHSDRKKVDGKKAVGINNVFIGTWTDAGRVILAIRQTLGGESKTAIPMIENLASLLGDRLHTVVWDKALSGMELHRLMAYYKILVVTKPVARASNQPTSDGHTARVMSEDAAFEAHEAGRPLPLGTTVQWVSGKRTMIRSQFHRFKAASIEVHGCCRDHNLWVDGGVLWDTYTDPADGGIYKHTCARALHAVPVEVETLVRRKVTAVWEVPTTWELKCPDAPDGVHRFTEVWEPLAIKKGRPADGPQRAMHDLRPLGVEDRRFWDIFGTRNNAESVNAWYKSTFRHKGRAMRLQSRKQYADQIAASFTMNALTWRTHRRQRDARLAPLGGPVG